MTQGETKRNENEMKHKDVIPLHVTWSDRLCAPHDGTDTVLCAVHI